MNKNHATWLYVLYVSKISEQYVNEIPHRNLKQAFLSHNPDFTNHIINKIYLYID